MIYIAYGSNLNKDQMAFRCPNATPLGKMYLPDYKLVFRGVADIIKKKGEFVPVGIWDVTDDCIKALDRYEGAPRLYQRVDIGMGFTYMMRHRDYAVPNNFYFEAIRTGYQDFDMYDDVAMEKLYEAYDEAAKMEEMDDDFNIHTHMERIDHHGDNK